MGVHQITPNMKAFAVLALLPFVTSAPDHGGHHVYHTPAEYQLKKLLPLLVSASQIVIPVPEILKHNSSIAEVTEITQECTPVILTACSKTTLPVKIIKENPFTYTVIRSVCVETTEEVLNEVCRYSYSDFEEETTGKDVEISFEKVEKVQMVTVCQPVPTYPAYGYGPAPGYGKRSADAPAHAPAPHGHGYGYGKQCKEVAQTTAYSVPKATVVEPAVTVLYPVPGLDCVDEQPIILPVIQCAILEEEKTIMVPAVEDSEIEIEKCISVLGAPECKGVQLTLPRQVAKELEFGHTDDTVLVAAFAAPAPAPEPAYAPAPAYASAPALAPEPAYAPAPEPAYAPAPLERSRLYTPAYAADAPAPAPTYAAAPAPEPTYAPASAYAAAPAF